jgi:general secretion pathway protein A
MLQKHVAAQYAGRLRWKLNQSSGGDRFAMYEAFYGLREKPFSILPDPDLIYWGHNHLLAFAMLEFGVTNSAGFTVITGEVGSGKTTLLRYLLRRLDPRIAVGLISNTPRGTEGLLQWVMMSLNQPYEASYPVLFERFHKFLRAEYGKGRRTVLIVDEAHNLGLDALEELRMLLNINADKSQFLQIILVGQPQLKEMLRKPELLQFAQRISSDYHLRPLKCEDVAKYINHRLAAVGAQRQLFSNQACDMIAEASLGIPRTINILCDTALVYGFAANRQQIDTDIIYQVIEDKKEFGVLPMPIAAG